MRIPLTEPVIGSLEQKYVMECLRSGHVSSVGPMIPRFEERFATWLGAPGAVATASGTAALHAALVAAGIGRGDAVIVPDLTFVASMNPVLYCGAEPVLVDVDPDTWCIDVGLLREVCRAWRGKKRLRAVIPVHLYGVMCDMKALMKVAREFDLLVIEDATEALGASINGRAAGLWGDLGCFSFNGNKIITTGAGGMVVGRSTRLLERVRHLVNQARANPAEYIHDEAGFNYRMDSLSAALGMAQMERLDGLLAHRRQVAKRYRAGLKGLAGVQLHPEQDGRRGSYWLYSVALRSTAARDSWLKDLNAAGIMARPFFVPLHRQPYVRRRLWTWSAAGAALCAFGVSDAVAAGGINLPSTASLTAAQQAKVIRHVRDLAGR